MFGYYLQLCYWYIVGVVIDIVGIGDYCVGRLQFVMEQFGQFVVWGSGNYFYCCCIGWQYQFVVQMEVIVGKGGGQNESKQELGYGYSLGELGGCGNRYRRCLMLCECWLRLEVGFVIVFRWL